MNLVASLIVRNEADRYLRPCLEHLLGFCDSVRIFDDGSTDDFKEIGWFEDDRVQIMRSSSSEFMEHEGRARQKLLDWTFEAQPSHVLAIDADEFVSDGAKLRELVETARVRHGAVTAWRLTMREVWTATRATLLTREDGLWGPRKTPCLYDVPVRRNAYRWRIANKAAACGREPQAVLTAANRGRESGVDILHFGWANVADRAARYERYAGDNFGHNATHIKSIMYGDDRVAQKPYEWPYSLEEHIDVVADRAQRGAAAVPEPLVLPPAVERRPGGRDYAFFRNHPDGRWVGIRWDGTVETS